MLILTMTVARASIALSTSFAIAAATLIGMAQATQTHPPPNTERKSEVYVKRCNKTLPMQQCELEWHNPVCRYDTHIIPCDIN
jgi:hypothetical protein